MTRIAIMARKSDTGPDGREVSTKEQIDEMRERVAEQGHEVVAELVEVVSASRYARRARNDFVEALRMIDAGEIDGIMFWDLDRLTRQPSDLEQLINRAEPARKGGREIAVLSYLDGKIDLSHTNGILFARGVVAGAAAESDKISDRVRRSRRAHRRDGKPNPMAVYGWSGTTTQDPAQAKVVREMFDKVSGGLSCADVARQLNERGVPTLFAGKPSRRNPERIVGEQVGWRQNTVRKSLLQPRNYGLVRHPDGSLTPGSFEGILPSDGLVQMSALLNSRDRGKGIRRPRRQSLTTGFVYCGGCGQTMMRGRTNHGRDGEPKTDYLHCLARNDRPGACGHNTIPADLVDEAIRVALCVWMDNVALSELMVDDEDAVALEAKLARLDAQIADARRRVRLPEGDPERIKLTTLDFFLEDALPERDEFEKALTNAVTKRHTVLAEVAGQPGKLAEAWADPAYSMDWRRRVVEDFLAYTKSRFVIEPRPYTRWTKGDPHEGRLSLVHI